MQGAGGGKRCGDVVLAAPLPHHEHALLNGVQWLGCCSASDSCSASWSV